MHVPVLTVVPAADLISLAEIKSQCRIDTADDDTLLSVLIQAATDHLDGWAGVLGRCLITQTWRQDFCDWPANGKLRLPFPDVQSVTVKYQDADDVETTMPSSLYELLEDTIGSYVRFRKDFTSPALYDDKEFPISVTLVAGYGSAASAVPDAIRQAAMILAAHWYENREAVTTGPAPVAVPMAVTSLIEKYRRDRI